MVALRRLDRRIKDDTFDIGAITYHRKYGRPAHGGCCDYSMALIKFITELGNHFMMDEMHDGRRRMPWAYGSLQASA